jgi:hypothetical protein
MNRTAVETFLLPSWVYQFLLRSVFFSATRTFAPVPVLRFGHLLRRTLVYDRVVFVANDLKIADIVADCILRETEVTRYSTAAE